MSAGSFRDRLRKLRRDGDPLPAGPEPEPRAEATSSGVARTTGEPEALESPDDGLTWARTTVFPVAHRHGDFELREVSAAASDDFVLLTGDTALGDLCLEDAVYLDTETTGLSGGAGTYVFMVGLGTFTERPGVGRSFEVWQGFMRNPGGEAALLAECARRIRASGSMVSFFGKSFDRHRLEDKMRLASVSPPFADRPHLDLYHPCRRLYRSAYEDGRLKTLEHRLCGLERPDDLPGAMAPEAWFDYLAGRPHQLEGVFRHNLDDVLSLVTLAAHLGRSTCELRANEVSLSGDPAHRAAGLARSFLKGGDRGAAVRWLDCALERGHPEERELSYLRAEALTRSGEISLALEAWRGVLAAPEDRFSCGALIELAKLLEHSLKDPAGALEAVRVSLALVERTLVGRAHASTLADLRKRRTRLEALVAQASDEK